jgi:short-subunit dehydrogenase
MSNFKAFVHTVLPERAVLRNYRLLLYEEIKENSEEKIKRKLQNKVVIVTGASSGIGKAIAKEYAQNGAKVVLAARNTEKLLRIKIDIEKSGGKAVFVETDVSKKSDCENLIKQTVNKFGKIDILVNNAGISMRASFSKLKLEVLERVMNINFWGTVYCSKFALPYLLEQKGSIIGISSISGVTPLPGRTGYVASKYAMDGFLNTLRIEYMKKGLHVLVVHPGFTASNIRNTALNDEGKSQKETPRNESKMMPSEQVAKIVVRATIKRKRDLVLTMQGKMAVWVYKNFPRLADKLIYKEMSKEPDSPF